MSIVVSELLLTGITYCILILSTSILDHTSESSNGIQKMVSRAIHYEYTGNEEVAILQDKKRTALVEYYSLYALLSID